MRVRSGSRVLLAIASAMAIPSAVIGQMIVEVGPLVALYTPVGTLNQNAVLYALPSKASDLRGVAWGAQGRVWLTPKLGVQVQGAAASSRFGGGVVINTPGGQYVTRPIRAQVLTVSAEALYRPVPTIVPLWVGAGAGVVRHGGDAYALFGRPSSLAGVLGLGFDTHMGRHVTAAFGITTLFYSLNFKGMGNTFDLGFRTDLLAHVALAWRSRLR